MSKGFHNWDEDGWCKNDGCMWNVWNAISDPECPVKLPRRATSTQEQEKLLEALSNDSDSDLAAPHAANPNPHDPANPGASSEYVLSTMAGKQMPLLIANENWWPERYVLEREAKAYERGRRDVMDEIRDTAFKHYKEYMADESDERDLPLSHFVSKEMGRQIKIAELEKGKPDGE